MTRTGVRGGNVRSLTEARALTETFKPDWTALVDEALREALQRGPTHADDLAHLELPSEHLNLVGSRIARLVNLGEIIEVGRRKSRNPASNARKSGIYRLVGSSVLSEAQEATPRPLVSTESVRSGDPGTAPGPSSVSRSPDRLFELEPVRPGHDRRAA